MHGKFDRAAEDLGNSIHLEHVNVQVPDQRLATLFYVSGLGLTRDPYLMTSDDNMWINVGRSQFHLPSGEAQVLRGHTGIVISGRALGRMRAHLPGGPVLHRDQAEVVAEPAQSQLERHREDPGQTRGRRHDRDPVTGLELGWGFRLADHAQVP